jgi:putative membrane protein
MGFGFVVARFGLFLREIAAMQGGPPPPTGMSRWFGIGLIGLGVLLTAASTATHLLTVAASIAANRSLADPHG